ncbi:hypothetical protein [Tetragenococcus muriaticus]|nr:hypothetical protein [Tetragenococcus muriaticus]GMA46481.1 hypothetical protein GCM10025854_07310 [Tetragenococcus muriaticus]
MIEDVDEYLLHVDDKKPKKKNRNEAFTPNLCHLLAYRMKQPNRPIDLAQLYKELSISTQANFKEEIYAIIPYGERYTQSFVFYKDTVRLVDSSANVLAEKFLYNHLFMDFESYKRTLNFFLNKEMNAIPISCSKFSLIPFSLTSKPTIYCWVNPGRIENLYSQGSTTPTIAQLTNGINVAIERQQRPIFTRMKRAFLTHGIIKRDIETQPVNVTMSLLEYLNISSTKITRKVTKNIQYQHIPGFALNFHQKYQEIHDAIVIEKWLDAKSLPKSENV